MYRVSIATWAVLLDLQALLDNLLVLGGAVVQGLADGALEFDECFLGHKGFLTTGEVYGNSPILARLPAG